MENALVGNTLDAVMNLSFTFIVLSSVFILLCVYAWKIGRGGIVALAAGVIVAEAAYAALVEQVLYQSIFSEGVRGFVLNAVVFAAILGFTVFVLGKFMHTPLPGETHKRLAFVALMAILTEGLIFSVAYRLLDIQASYAFSPFADRLFGAEHSFILWVCALFVSLFLVGSRR